MLVQVYRPLPNAQGLKVPLYFATYISLFGMVFKPFFTQLERAMALT